MMAQDSSVLLSIIVPIYNVRSYLPDILFSLDRFDGAPFEIVFVDDASTDGGHVLVEAFAQKSNVPTKLIRLSQNGGLSAARNAGLDVALGDYVWFVDSDDMINPDFDPLHVLEMAKAEGVDIVALDYHYVHTKENQRLLSNGAKVSVVLSRGTAKRSARRRFDASRVLTHDDQIMEKLFQDCRMYVWSAIFRRSLFETIRFEVGRYFEDIGTAPSLFAAAQKIIYVDESAILYRKHGASIMSRRSSKKDLDIASAVHHNTPNLLKNSAKLSESDVRAWAAFSLLTICWGTRSLIAYGDLHKRDVWPVWKSAVARHKALPVPEPLKRGLRKEMTGRIERLLGTLVELAPASLYVMSFMLEKSSIIRRVAGAAYRAMRT